MMKRVFIYLGSLLIIECGLAQQTYPYQRVPWQDRSQTLYQKELLSPILTYERTKEPYNALATLIHYSPNTALQSIERFVKKYPLDIHREEINLHKGIIFLQKGEYHRARYYLEKVDETTLTGDILAEWKVRLAYSLIKTKRQISNLCSLFESASLSKGYWGKVASLYLAGEYLAKGETQKARDIYKSLQKECDFLYDGLEGYLASLYYEGNYTAVLTEGEKIKISQKDISSSANFLKIMGSASCRLGNSFQSLTYFTPYFRQYDSLVSAEDRILYGVSLVNEGKSDKAEKILRPAIEESSGSTKEIATLYLSRALREKGLYSESISSYEILTHKETTSVIREVAMYEMVLVMHHYRQSHFGQDIRIVEEFINSFPTSKYRETIEKFLLEFYFSNTDYAYSYKSIQRIQNKNKPLQSVEQFILNRLLYNSLENNQLNEAQEYLHIIFKKNIPNKTFYGESLLLASQLYEKKGEISKARQFLNKFIGLPASNNGSNLSEVYYRLGYFDFNERHFRKAIEYFDASLSRAGNLDEVKKSDIYSRLGDCYFALGNLREALVAYDLSNRSIQKNNLYALSRKAEILGIRKQYHQQIETLNTIISSNQGESFARKALLEKGKAYQLSGAEDKATETLQVLIDQYSEFEEGKEASLRLALLYYNRNHIDKAISIYRNIIQQFPSSYEAQQAFKNLKSICTDEGRIDLLGEIVKDENSPFKLSDQEERKLHFEIARNSAIKEEYNAKEKLTTFINQYPHGADTDEILIRLGELYFRQGEETKAYTLYDELEKRIHSLTTKQRLYLYQKMAKIEEDKQDYKKAFKHYCKASQECFVNEEKISLANLAMEQAKKGNIINEGISFANEFITKVSSNESLSIRLLRADLHIKNGNNTAALKDWDVLILQPKTIEGSKAYIAKAEWLLKNNKMKQAKQLLQQFIESDTPQEYWLAKGYILLAESYIKEGDKAIGRGYLLSLQKNYPQKGDDIHSLIAKTLKQYDIK